MLLRTKRAAVLFGLIAFLLLLDLVQLYGVASNAEYADKAQQQIQITLSMPRERGLILDRSGLPLTPVQPVRYAGCLTMWPTLGRPSFTKNEMHFHRFWQS